MIVDYILFQDIVYIMESFLIVLYNKNNPDIWQDKCCTDEDYYRSM